MGYPENRLVLAEALRYMYLSEYQRERLPIGDFPILLVITGYQLSEVDYQMRLLIAVGKDGALNKFGRIMIKPHPYTPIPDRLLKELGLYCKLEVAILPLKDLWAKSDLVFVSNSTAAVLEAICIGLPIAICGPSDTMNLSPLFGEASVPMISNPQQLIAFLTNPSSPDFPANCFILNKSLTLWRELIGENGIVNAGYQ